jgi:hypothetical protein
MTRRVCRTSAAAWIAAGSGLLASVSVAQQAPDQRAVYYDAADREGRLSGGVLFLPVEEAEPAAPVEAPVVTLWDPDAGVIDSFTPERLDIVLVGDGYQASELWLYEEDADYAMSALFAQEPFRTYQNFFRIHRVDVISQDSGVDHDPVYPIYRNTALDMEFWCSGIERALCVDVRKAYSYARSAPYLPDQVLAIANSLKYGGSGYPADNLATLSGGDFWAPETALHEFGHSIANLADEYDYEGGIQWVWPEPGEANASVYPSSVMVAGSRKWHRWIGVSEPAWDGLVSTYEGCYYYLKGIHRPTFNSKMRNLGRPFNLPSAEALIAEFYRVVRPIDDSTPTGGVLTGSETVFVKRVELVGRALDVQWYLDDEPIPGATAASLDLMTVAIPSGVRKLRATVVDNTPWVRDPTIRATRLSESRTWAVEGVCYADCDGSGALDFFDFLCFQNLFAAGDPQADCDSSGGLDFFDFLCFQNAFAAGCP